MTPDKKKDAAPEEEVLGGILEDVVDRRRAGAKPTANEYAARYPKLADTIGAHLDLIEYLESASGAWQDSRAGKPSGVQALALGGLAGAIAGLPEPSQRVVYLRHFEHLPWREIAERLCESEKVLRKRHATAFRLLIEHCREWLETEHRR
jgi:DNA-directed RNA polymerase specialized sigma24 family protein